MSKITQALEKAAHERLLRQQQKAAVAAHPTASAVPAPEHPQPLGEVRPAASAVEVLPSSSSVPATGGSTNFDRHIVVASDPQSFIAEQYRILRTNLQSMQKQGGLKVLLVTSAVHGEGKSVTSINLALSLAQQEGMKVLLVDADMRRGTIRQWMKLSAERGLSTALTNGGGLDGLILPVPDSRLSVLPAGPTPENPAELLDSDKMRGVMEALRGQFDVIVIDAPPVLPVADPGILGRFADGTLLVVRAGATQWKTVNKAKSLLLQTETKIVGCVLTHTEHMPGYYKNYYHYYSRSATNGGNGVKAQAQEKGVKEKGHTPVSKQGR